MTEDPAYEPTEETRAHECVYCEAVTANPLQHHHDEHPHQRLDSSWYWEVCPEHDCELVVPTGEIQTHVEAAHPDRGMNDEWESREGETDFDREEYAWAMVPCSTCGHGMMLGVAVEGLDGDELDDREVDIASFDI